jgi:hypothetical protein
MPRINRAIELLAEDQAIYYVGAHTGHVLTAAQGVRDSKTWADYINVGMEHGAFDMTGLAEYLRGLVDGGPTRSGHRAPTVIVEAPVVPGRDRRRGARLCRELPLSASPRRRRQIAADPVAAVARHGGRQAGHRTRRRHARSRLGVDRRSDLGRVAAGIYGAVRPLAAQSEGRIAARGQA